MGLFKTLLVMVMMHRYVPGGAFSGYLGEILSAQWMFYTVIVLGTAEIIADMIPRIDLKWHRWTGHLRIAGSAVLVWMILTHEDVASQVMMSIVGVALAITSYVAVTSARRAAVRGSTGHFVAPIASITENCMIPATLLPLTRLPQMTLLMVAFMAMASLLVIYVVRREARETFAWLFAGRWIEPQPVDTSGSSTD